MMIIIIIIIVIIIKSVVPLGIYVVSPFHFLLSLAIGLNSLQLLLPDSVNVLLCQMFLGLPVFLEPCGFHIKAALQGFLSLFLNVWLST
jgi:hypothetical protein